MIFAILGRSGSGKTTITKIVENTLLIKRIIMHTTRPMRIGEEQGVEYVFTDNDSFISNFGNMVATDFIKDRDWHYGYSKKELLDYDNSVVAVSPKGYKELVDEFGEMVVGIYIYVEPRELLKRSISREEEPDCVEICRRFLADEKDFNEIIHDEKLYIIDNTEHISNCVTKTLQIIQKKRR